MLAAVQGLCTQALMYPLLVAVSSQSPSRRQAAAAVVDQVRQHSATLVEQAELVRTMLGLGLVGPGLSSDRTLKLYRTCLEAHTHLRRPVIKKAWGSVKGHWMHGLKKGLGCSCACHLVPC